MNRLVKYGLLTMFVAVVANALVQMITLSVSTVPTDFWPLGLGAVIISTVLTVGGATIVYGGITRFSTRPNRTFTIIAAVVLLFSFGSFVAPPSVLAAAPTSVLAALAVMHVIVAVVSIGVLTRAADNAETPKSIKNKPT
ncbi:DUF6069 family protein [Haladaptatus halobius]|uniref:DUF6069 family protein n=1 Tax=Haladaptatus halobius TaxID=2884875 RepID=UPI001D0B5BAD|nr:DUF6069 family protein [Haladaptatus halobius]